MYNTEIKNVVAILNITTLKWSTPTLKDPQIQILNGIIAATLFQIMKVTTLQYHQLLLPHYQQSEQYEAWAQLEQTV